MTWDLEKKKFVEMSEIDLKELKDPDNFKVKRKEFEKVIIEKKKIVKVVTSSFHTLCLSNEGECIIFGINESKFNSRIPGTILFSLPEKIGKHLGYLPPKVIDIACSKNMSVIVLENGEVYSCGQQGKKNYIFR